MDAVKMNENLIKSGQWQSTPQEMPAKDESQGWFKKIADYFEPRSSTTGGTKESSALRAAVGGGIQGFFTGGPQAAAGGSIGGYAGLKMGEKTGSIRKALATSALAGAGSTVIAASLIAVIMAGPAGIALLILATAATGAIAGSTGSAIEVLRHIRAKKMSEAAYDEKASEQPPEIDRLPCFAQQTPDAGQGLLAHVKDLAEKGCRKVKEAAGTMIARYGSKGAAGLTGALIGAGLGMLGGPLGIGLGALTGALSGFIGSETVTAANKNNSKLSFKRTFENSGLGMILGASGAALLGAGACALATANPLGAALILSSAAIYGALTGVAGMLSGCKSSSMSDGSIWGFTGGMLTKSLLGLGGPLTPLTTAIGSAMGTRAQTNAGKALRGALAGGAVGALTGAFGGPVAMAVCAALGATISAAGAVLGTKLQQGIRNLTDDLMKKLKPFSEKTAGVLIEKLGTKRGLIADGIISGAIGYAPLGMMGAIFLGPLGAVMPSAVGAVLGGIKMAAMSKEIDNSLLVRTILEKKGPTVEDMGMLMCSAAFPQIEKSMASAPPQEKQRYFERYLASTVDDLKADVPQVQQTRNGVSALLYNDMKTDLKALKTPEEKIELLEERIAAVKPALTQMMVNHLIALLQAQQSPEEAQKAA
jgi:hypothetical protein